MDETWGLSSTEFIWKKKGGEPLDYLNLDL